MYFLYPRLPLPAAEALVQRYSTLSIDELKDLGALTHVAVQFAPTGGNRISPQELDKLQNMVRECASLHGYPELVGDNVSRKFDVQCGILLHQNMRLHPSEASHLEMWAFIGCVLLPDIVRWRFSGDATDKLRFIGEDRGLRRHTFGRLWWRTYLLYQPNWNEPYDLFNHLYEDDLVQITERNSIAASPLLVKTFCLSFLQAVEQYKSVARRDLIREASKRLFRLLSIVSFETLEEEAVQGLINNVFEDTALSLMNIREEELRS